LQYGCESSCFIQSITEIIIIIDGSVCRRCLMLHTACEPVFTSVHGGALFIARERAEGCTVCLMPDHITNTSSGQPVDSIMFREFKRGYAFAQLIACRADSSVMFTVFSALALSRVAMHAAGQWPAANSGRKWVNYNRCRNLAAANRCWATTPTRSTGARLESTAPLANSSSSGHADG
jgi:hypothetical protein